MPESNNSTIPPIPEPIVLAWTANYEEGDEVAYIAGSPPPPAVPVSSIVSLVESGVLGSGSGSRLQLVREEEEGELVGELTSTAAATVASGSDSRRVSGFETVVNGGSGGVGMQDRIMVQQQQQQVLPDTSHHDAMQNGNPPRYTEARIPTCTLDYTFSPVDDCTQSMILIPPHSAPDTRPVYHIKVTHDLFDPTFFVTTVRRGGRADGDVVGDFVTKPGCSTLEETVYYNKVETYIFKKLGYETKKAEWRWKLYRHNEGYLRWKWDKHWQCVHVTDPVAVKNKHYHLVAQFFPPEGLRSPSNPEKLAQMRVHPSGQKIFDELIISVLILERRRRTPQQTR